VVSPSLFVENVASEVPGSGEFGSARRRLASPRREPAGASNDLDYQEIHGRQEWEHKVVGTKDRTALQPELASAGAEGWELVSATAMFNTLMTKVVYTLFLKRPVS
jgi:hypothetical protein